MDDPTWRSLTDEDLELVYSRDHTWTSNSWGNGSMYPPKLHRMGSKGTAACSSRIILNSGPGEGIFRGSTLAEGCLCLRCFPPTPSTDTPTPPPHVAETHKKAVT